GPTAHTCAGAEGDPGRLAGGLRYLRGIVGAVDYVEITRGGTRITRASQSRRWPAGALRRPAPGRTGPTRPAGGALAARRRRAARDLGLPGRLWVGVRIQRRDEQAAAALRAMARADRRQG